MARNQPDPWQLLLGLQANALGGGGNLGQTFPSSDVEDFARGAYYIPDAVTLARRAGQHVVFSTACEQRSCWFWQLPDGDRLYYADDPYAAPTGPCPHCGNPWTRGQTVSAAEVRAAYSD